MAKHNEVNDKFFLRCGERAMVSLGPLCDDKHCPYSCAFCYVQDDFESYAKMSEDEIVDYLRQTEGQYTIIYISGDTDSFAPPRVEQGLSLLLRIANEFDCDMLFTTRTVFNAEQIQQLSDVVAIQKSKNKQLFGCISITRYSQSLQYLEPSPVPTPDERINTIKCMHDVGIVTVLALRPFLPMVPIKDYLTIIDKSRGFVDIVLGEHFYFIRNGVVQKRVFIDGMSEDIEKNIISNNKMMFNVNNSEWDIWRLDDYEYAVRTICNDYGIVFSMHSEDALRVFKQTKCKIN